MILFTTKDEYHHLLPSEKSVAYLELQEERTSRSASLQCGTSAELHRIAKGLENDGKAGSLRLLNEAGFEHLVVRGVLPTIVNETHTPLSRWRLIEELCRGAFGRDGVRLGILGTFGEAYGDSILFCTYLRILTMYLSSRLPLSSLRVFQRNYAPLIDEMYRLDLPAIPVTPLPTRVSELRKCDVVIDHSVALPRADIPWIDGLLYASGINATSVPAASKRNQMNWTRRSNAPYELLSRTREASRPLVLIHGQASTMLRTMPDRVMIQLLRHLLDTTSFTLVLDHHCEYKHPRIWDASSFASSFSDLCALISLCDGFVTVDTSVYHVADACDKPGVVLFTTQDPQRFISYYPHIRGMKVCGTEIIDGQLGPGSSELQPVLEKLWERLDLRSVSANLVSALAARSY